MIAKPGDLIKVATFLDDTFESAGGPWVFMGYYEDYGAFVLMDGQIILLPEYYSYRPIMVAPFDECV